MKKILILLLLIVSNHSQAIVYFVSPAGLDAHTGLSWGQSFKTLQKAISVANAGDEIWVAKGTYYPDDGNGLPGNDRSLSFDLKNGSKIYGGFTGMETTVAQRNWITNVTLLSGEIQQDANNANNSYHVVVSTNTNANTIVDGFTITEGNANGAGVDKSGGGWLNDGSGSGNNSMPTIKNCIFFNNSAIDFGGGIVNYGFQGDASPMIVNCTFKENASSMSGGAVFNYGQYGISSPTITNCVFTDNSSGAGGAVYNSGDHGVSNTIFVNCSFNGNSSTSYGGAVANDGENGISRVNIVNCSYSNNTSPWGGAIFNLGTGGTCTPTLSNCILWGNGNSEIYNESASPVISYTMVKGITNYDPLFVNAATGDLHLQSCSPAVNRGNNAVVTATTDIDGNARLVNNIVDLGAYELQRGNSNIVYVNQAAVGLNNGSSWNNAFTSLQDALTTSNCSGNQIWVAKGTYYTDDGTGFVNNDRNSCFDIKSGLQLYGGFTGTETLASQRNWKSNLTILSAEIQQDDNKVNNAYHVIRTISATSATVIDGFTITGGNSNGVGSQGFLKQLGGGWFNDGSNADNISNPTISNCIFLNNYADIAGGAVFNSSYGGGIASPSILNCSFIGNSAPGKYDGGGAFYNDGLEGGTANPTFSNCIFNGNMATHNGAAIYSISSGNGNPIITNCTFTANVALSGSAICNSGPGVPTISNCILWKNGSSEIATDPNDFNSTAPVVSNSIVKGGYPGIANINNDPLFINTATGDLHLNVCSPAINTGNNATVIQNFDIQNNTRIINGTVDMGAYELQTGSCCPGGNVFYVNKLATGLNNGHSWTDAFTSLQDALLRTGTCSGIRQIWVAKGTYYTDEGSDLSHDDRNLSFNLLNGIGLFGGFNGTEKLLTQRNGKLNTTTLSGEIQQDNDKKNNALKVVNVSTGTATVFDGFTITGGTGN